MRELEEASPLIDARYSLFGRPDALEKLEPFLDARRAAAGPYALVVNLEAHPTAARASRLMTPRYVARTVPDPDAPRNAPNLGIDRLGYDVWNRAGLLDDYPELRSQFLAEIFCRIARVETDFARLEVPAHDPERTIPPVLVSAGSRRPVKNWPEPYWIEVAKWLAGRGLDIGVLGAPPEYREKYRAASVDEQIIDLGGVDLRAPALTLPQAAGAIARTRVFITLDSALMHFAAAVRTPTVVIWGDGSPRRIWAPPVPNLHILKPAEPCVLCEDNRFRNDDCLLPVHECMGSITPLRVIAEVERLLELG